MSRVKALELFNAFKASKSGITKFSLIHGFYKGSLAIVFKRFFADDYEEIMEQKTMRRDEWFKAGIDFEMSVRDHLSKLGYFVLRSARSRTVVDLVALKANKTLLVQCKKSSTTLLFSEKGPLLGLAEKLAAIPILACRPTGRGILFRKCEDRAYSEFTP